MKLGGGPSTSPATKNGENAKLIVTLPADISKDFGASVGETFPAIATHFEAARVADRSHQTVMQ